MKEKTSKAKYIFIHIGVIILASLIAIAVHALMPADTNVEDFDSVFVKILSFPVVASLYFIILFTHCAVTVSYFGKKTNLSGLSIGLRFGIAYAIIYLLGMQEVVLSASPYSEWGVDFVLYQLIIGISDAIPVVLMCTLLGKFTIKNTNKVTYKRNYITDIAVICLIALTFTIVRVISYNTGIVSSDLAAYPIQTYAWTIIFGLGLGFIYVLLYPIYKSRKESTAKFFLLSIGLNWVIFNSFIGLIFDGLIWEMLLRSILDIIPVFIITLIIDSFSKKSTSQIL